MVVWIQFPAFPVHFYHMEILFTIGNMIGRAIKLDFHTQHQQRAKFARIAVELDLSKPLITRIRLDGKWQYIEYENLPTCCFECGKIGDTSLTCPLTMMKAQQSQSEPSQRSPENWEETPSEDKAGFGPWMQVTRRTRRNNRKAEKGNSNVNQGEAAGNGRPGKGKHVNTDVKILNGKKGGQKETGKKETGAQEKGRADDNGQRKGKEGAGKDMVEEATGGKGILGPIPSAKAGLFAGLNKETGLSRSKEPGAKPSSSGNRPSGGHNKPKPNDNTSPASPPPTTQLTGPNATNIQIVSVPTLEMQKDSAARAEAPSATARTKNRSAQNKKKAKSPRKSPTKVAMRALQVWTPVKERKSKARAKMASLTLEEIAAWTSVGQSGQEVGGEPGLPKKDARMAVADLANPTAAS
ncbi:unnamed protein product [Linum trigynum]|uniref:DUF4283 domain-containing protein n=1 Tax=Linum trigynum TaxID=586398 RepID=A0AAV2CWR9_9ROSI